jgi:dihydrofolate reductase
MKLSLVAAMAKGRVIGKDNQMPWHLPADLQHFKKVTMGKPIVMGRKTYDSIGRPLPGRCNIVITRQENLSIAGCDVFNSIPEALAELSDENEVMIIGGGNLYEQALPLVDYLYLTFIDLEVEGDAFFPVWVEADWKEISLEKHMPDDKNLSSYCFVEFERVRSLGLNGA